MKDSRDIVQQVAREAEASRPTSPTAAGQTERRPPGDGHIDAINQVFALFRLNYHNQYYAAYPDDTQLKQIKKLWLESLGHYPVEQILLGAKYAIEHSDYLPTLHRMIESCQQCLVELGLPAPREAYEEACNAPSPKARPSVAGTAPSPNDSQADLFWAVLWSSYPTAPALPYGGSTSRVTSSAAAAGPDAAVDSETLERLHRRGDLMQASNADAGDVTSKSSEVVRSI